MAGCYGNHPFDRAMESQLMQHLDGEAEVDNYVEEVIEKVKEPIYKKYEEYLCGDVKVDDWIIVLMRCGVDTTLSALVIEVLVAREYGDSKFIKQKEAK